MMEIFTSVIEMLMPVSIIVMPPLWLCFAVYAAWYFTSAKHYAPLTLDEAKILWKIHKKDAKCRARKMQIVSRGAKIIGFKCECGYKYLQKRPII
jgi:hypothetical protein